AGCGDVGSVLATALLQDGHVVYGLKRDTSTLPEGVLPVVADLLDPATLKDLPENFDWLIFMPTPASRDQAAYEAIFIQGWKNLWAGLRQLPARVLLVSSTAVYGEDHGGIVDEETRPDPTGFNGKVLLKMEQVAHRCTENLVIVRISGIYGPGRERLIRLAISHALEVQQTPPYFTNRIHRDDAAAVLKHLLEIDKPEALYLATDDKPASRYEVIEWLANIQGSAAPKGLVDENASRGKRVSNRRLRDSGFSFTYTDYRTGYAAVLKLRQQK
ncbi:MAG: SDR family oxidoreductase, partial [Xanthomonadales bacterium]|nr:SDR family oxidoreductase [Xanthomonadales bacterium]